ncbi:hypothetical protein MASR2M78_04400 [Treponema sp.]
MKESARTACCVLTPAGPACESSVAEMAKSDFHIHVPEGAIPKDGPSAGITLAAVLLSTLRGIAPKSRVAMTGELTLTGRILPIGGVKEKLLAAIRNHMELVIIPKANADELAELDEDIRTAIKVVALQLTQQNAFAILFEDLEA